MIGDPMNLKDLSDNDLDALRVDVLVEQERRENLAQIPSQIVELREKYVSGGGDPDDLL